MTTNDLKTALVFAAVFFLWALVHSLLASLTVKRFAERYLGRFYAFYRLFYVVFALASLAAVWLAVPQPRGSVYQAGGVFFIILKGIQTLALIGFLFAGSQFNMEDFLGISAARRFHSARLEPNPPEPLNTGEFFSYVRHPLYLLGMIIFWSDPEMTLSWFTLSLAVTIYLVAGSFFEERKLIAIYGDEYREYRRRVRRFLPIRRKST